MALRIFVIAKRMRLDEVGANGRSPLPVMTGYAAIHKESGIESALKFRKSPRFITSFAILLWVIFGGLSLLFAAAPAEPSKTISVTTDVDKNFIAIGDKIKYTVKVSTAKDIEVEFPCLWSNLGDFVLKGSGSSQRFLFGRKKIVRWAALSVYKTGKLVIPKMAIKYKGEADKDWNQLETDEKTIEVKSLLEGAKKASDIRDIKGPVGLARRLNFYLLLLTLFAVLAIIFPAIIFLRKKIMLGEIKLRPAHEIAYEELGALKRRDLIKQGKIKEYYFEISAIIRRYLENRFNLRAPEMTTEEFLNKVKDSSELAAEHKVLLREFLVCCDMVKFAKYAPSEAEMASIYESAVKFVDQTKEEVQESGAAKMQSNGER